MFLDVDYREYGKKFEFDGVTYDMTDDERMFVSGLIRRHKPKRILELGVAEGGVLQIF